LNEVQKQLKLLYENKKKCYPIKYPWNPEKENDYAVFCARDLLEIIEKMTKEFEAKCLPLKTCHSTAECIDNTKEWYMRWLASPYV